MRSSASSADSGSSSSSRRGAAGALVLMFLAGAEFHQRLDAQRDQRQQRQQRRHRERGREVVLVVKNFHVQRHGVGQAADMARDHRHRTKLAHRPRVAQDHPVDPVSYTHLTLPTN